MTVPGVNLICAATLIAAAGDPRRFPSSRKQAEGKTRREAIRCLKRHLARRVWHLLQPDPATTTPTSTPRRRTRSVTIHCNTPTGTLDLT